MSKIVLSTINARYIHSSFGLRYIYANLKELIPETTLIEFILQDKIDQIVENLLSYKPKIIGLSVYIWNAIETKNVINLIKKINPEITIVLGGPEASYYPHRVDFSKADYIIMGEGEIEFYNLSKKILSQTFPQNKIINTEVLNLDNVSLPYKFYSTEDIQNRIIYVEASRGCPFTCEFCLSSIDKSVRSFAIEKILIELQELWERGARSFKFVDRTFNLKVETSNKILDFFLEKTENFNVHFEVIPDNFPLALRDKIKQFPPASLQLEIGIQTLNSDIAKNIRRKYNLGKIKENLNFLENETAAHLHLDLIIGLPGESIESFANNLNQLTTLTNSEIQLGILKKLSGTTLDRHDSEYGMIYSDLPPYEIVKNNMISFAQMQELKRFARYWDLIYNSGNFKDSVKLLFEGNDVFNSFQYFNKWMFKKTNSTWNISLNRIVEIIFDYLTNIKQFDKTSVANSLVLDISRVKERKVPKYLKQYATVTMNNGISSERKNKRQLKRL